jgi:hypothetical protein
MHQQYALHYFILHSRSDEFSVLFNLRQGSIKYDIKITRRSRIVVKIQMQTDSTILNTENLQFQYKVSQTDNW